MSALNKTLIGVIIGLLLILAGSIVWNQNIQRQSNNWKHNYEVVQDSMQVIETKYGETLYENSSLIIEKKELENALGISKRQVKDYEKKLGSSLAYISKLESQLKIRDTIRVTEVIYDPLYNTYVMQYDDEWLKFDEKFHLMEESSFLEVYNIFMNVPLRVGLTDDYKIFVTSSNPYFNVTDIEGAAIDKSKFVQKKPRWTLSVYAGYGIQYGLINKQLDTGPQIGIGCGFRIF